MEHLLIPIIKMNVAVAGVTLLYFFILRKSTFFRLNRSFLLLAMGLVILAPFVTFTEVSYVQLAAGNILQDISQTTFIPGSVSHISTKSIIAHLYGIGICVMLLFLLIRLVSILKLSSRSTRVLYKNRYVYEIPDGTAPFSYFNLIFINLRAYNADELNIILYHESIHSRQLHSIDMLFSELIKIICWCNPLAWLLPRLIYQNLEFIADDETISFSKDKRQYQYTLLRATHAKSTERSLFNHFNISPLKTRIAMMNKQRTDGKFRLYYFAAVLIITALIFSTGKIFAQSKTVIITTDADSIQEQAYRHPAKQGIAIKAIGAAKTDKDKAGPERVMPDTIVKTDTQSVTLHLSNIPSRTYTIQSYTRDTLSKEAASFLQSHEWKRVDNKDTLNMNVHVKYGDTIMLASGNHSYRIRVLDSDTNDIEGPVLKTLAERGVSDDAPLIVIDGKEKPHNTLQEIKPDNIESLTILKNPSAMEQYGEDAKYGAILITTKEH